MKKLPFSSLSRLVLFWCLTFLSLTFWITPLYAEENNYQDLGNYIAQNVDASLIKRFDQSKKNVEYLLKEKYLTPDTLEIGTEYFKNYKELVSELFENFEFYTFHSDLPTDGSYLMVRMALVMDAPTTAPLSQYLPPQMPITDFIGQFFVNQKAKIVDETRGKIEVNYLTSEDDSQMARSNESHQFGLRGYYSSFYRSAENNHFLFNGLLGVEDNFEFKNNAVRKCFQLDPYLRNTPDAYLFLWGKKSDSQRYQGHELVVRFYPLEHHIKDSLKGKMLVTVDGLVFIKDASGNRLSNLLNRRETKFKQSLQQNMEQTLLIFADHLIKIVK